MEAMRAALEADDRVPLAVVAAGRGGGRRDG
jgi:hypothetical protein